MSHDENEAHKLLWGFEIQTDHHISPRRPYLVINKKKKRICLIEDSAVSDYRVKLKVKKKND